MGGLCTKHLWGLILFTEQELERLLLRRMCHRFSFFLISIFFYLEIVENSTEDFIDKSSWRSIKTIFFFFSGFLKCTIMINLVSHFLFFFFLLSSFWFNCFFSGNSVGSTARLSLASTFSPTEKLVMLYQSNITRIWLISTENHTIVLLRREGGVLSRHPSLSSSFLADHLDGIQCFHRAYVSKSIKESRRWILLNFSSSPLHVLFILIGWFVRWEAGGCTTAVLCCDPPRICSR